MNKQEIAIVIVLSALLFVWFHQQNKYARERLAAAREQAAIAATNAPPTTLSSEAQTTAAFQEGGQPSAAITPVSEVPAAPALPPDEIPTKVPEQTASLVNDQMQLAISSKGGTIRSATLCGYRSTVDRDSPPVELGLYKRSRPDPEGSAGLRCPGRLRPRGGRHRYQCHTDAPS